MCLRPSHEVVQYIHTSLGFHYTMALCYEKGNLMICEDVEGVWILDSWIDNTYVSLVDFDTRSIFIVRPAVMLVPKTDDERPSKRCCRK